MNNFSDIPTNLSTIRTQIDAAAKAASRDPRSISLIAVSKTHPMGAVKAALEAGQRVFGENRVQEAAKKFPKLREAYSDLQLHLIGPLQSNKVKEAVTLFDAIHSVDRSKLAKALGEEMRRQGKRPACFIEVNIGNEPQKSGIAPAELDAFLAACKEEYGLPVMGLMCIPPAGDNPLPHFQRLKALASRSGAACLSMGMSADFTAAIAAGATHVRVGSAIFGKREIF